MTSGEGITTAGAGTGGVGGGGRGRDGGGSDISRIPAQRAAVAVRRLVVPQQAVAACRSLQTLPALDRMAPSGLHADHALFKEVPFYGLSPNRKRRALAEGRISC